MKFIKSEGIPRRNSEFQLEASWKAEKMTSESSKVETGISEI